MELGHSEVIFSFRILFIVLLPPQLLTRYMPDPLQTIGIPESNRLGYDNLIFPALVLSFGACGAVMVVVAERLVRRAAAKIGIRPRQLFRRRASLDQA